MSRLRISAFVFQSTVDSFKTGRSKGHRSTVTFAKKHLSNVQAPRLMLKKRNSHICLSVIVVSISLEIVMYHLLNIFRSFQSVALQNRWRNLRVSQNTSVSPPTVQDMTVSTFLESQIPRSNNSSFLSSLPSCRSLVLSFSSVDCITCLPLGPLCLDSLITESMHKSKSVCVYTLPPTYTHTQTHTCCG